jgi:hypothetical protein
LEAFSVQSAVTTSSQAAEVETTVTRLFENVIARSSMKVFKLTNQTYPATNIVIDRKHRPNDLTHSTIKEQ